MNRKPLVYLISDGTLTPDNFERKSFSTLRVIENAISCGVSHVQIREKQLPARLVFELTCKAVELARRASSAHTKILVNDRADVAVTAGADGVHLTAGSLAASDIKRCFGVDFIIGVSTHDLAEVRGAIAAGADFAVFGPVFETPRKGAPVGLEGFRRVAADAGDFPLVALGGIDETNYVEALTVASGIAAIRFLNDRDKCRELMKQLNERQFK